MSRIETGPRVLTESSTVTTVGFSAKEADVVEISVKYKQGQWGGGIVRGESRAMGEDKRHGFNIQSCFFLCSFMARSNSQTAKSWTYLEGQSSGLLILLLEKLRMRKEKKSRPRSRALLRLELISLT